MDKLLYQLTMRCDSEHCEFDLALHRIRWVDKNYIYLTDRSVQRDILGTIIPQYSLHKVLFTSFFLKKEAALIIASQMVVILYTDHSMGDMLFDIAKQEWMRLRKSIYDVKWFLNNQKADGWQQEFQALSQGCVKTEKNEKETIIMPGKYLYQLRLWYYKDNSKIEISLNQRKDFEQGNISQKQGRQREREKISADFKNEPVIIEASFRSREMALVLSREMFTQLIEKNPKARKEVEKEWQGILIPSSNKKWYLGNMNESDWKHTFWSEMQEELDQMI